LFIAIRGRIPQCFDQLIRQLFETGKRLRAGGRRRRQRMTLAAGRAQLLVVIDNVQKGAYFFEQRVFKTGLRQEIVGSALLDFSPIFIKNARRQNNDGCFFPAGLRLNSARRL
jgi:hypothetical protein